LQASKAAGQPNAQTVLKKSTSADSQHSAHSAQQLIMSAIVAQTNRDAATLGANPVARALALMKATRERTQDQLQPKEEAQSNQVGGERTKITATLPKWCQLLETALYWLQEFNLGQDDPVMAFPDGFVEEARRACASAADIGRVVAETITTSGEPALLAAFYVLVKSELLSWAHAVHAMENVSPGNTTNVFVDAWTVLQRRYYVSMLERETNGDHDDVNDDADNNKTDMDRSSNSNSSSCGEGFAGDLCSSIILKGIFLGCSSATARTDQEEESGSSINHRDGASFSSAMSTRVLVSTVTQVISQRYKDPTNTVLTSLFVSHVSKTLLSTAAQEVGLAKGSPASKEERDISRNSIIQALINATFTPPPPPPTMQQTSAPHQLSTTRLVDASLDKLASVVTPQDISLAIGRFSARTADPFCKDGLGTFASFIRKVCTIGDRRTAVMTRASTPNEYTRAISSACEGMVMDITRTHMEQQRGAHLSLSSSSMSTSATTAATVLVGNGLDTARYLGCVFILIQHALLNRLEPDRSRLPANR
jgi:hypothetical protein